MSLNKFQVNVDLSNFFNDYRKLVKILINEQIKTIEDVEKKLTTLFDVGDIHLFSENSYLPPSEDVAILLPGEILCAKPQNTNSLKKYKKRKSVLIEDVENHATTTSERKKRKHLPYSGNDLNGFEATEFLPENEIQKEKSSSKISKIKKSKKEHAISSEQIVNSIGMDLETDNLSKEVVKKKTKKKQNPTGDVSPCLKNASKEATTKASSEKKEYICKGTLQHYLKNTPVPTITHEYLNEKKINIVKIDIIKPPSSLTNEICRRDSSDFKDTLKKCEDVPQTNSNISANNSLPTGVEKNESGVSQASTVDSTTSTTHTAHDVSKKSKIRKRAFFFHNSSVMSPCLTDTDSSVKDNPERNYKQRCFTMKSPQISKTDLIPVHELLNLVEHDEDSPIKENSVEDFKQKYFQMKNFEISKCENSQEKIEDISAPVLVENTVELNEVGEIDERKTNENSCDASNLSITINDSLELEFSTHHSISSMSGFQNLDCSKSQLAKPMVDTGDFVDKPRLAMTPPKSPSKESEGGHFITKRKRKRVRKHKKTQAAPVEISTHSSFTDTSPHIQAHPSLHFKFEYDNEDDDRVNIVSLKNGNDDRETNIDFNNICSDKETLEEKITKAPLIEGIVPNEGDVVAFKILRMTESYTPEISDFITGQIVQLEQNNLVFNIISGLDQCQQPEGKFSIADDSPTGRKNGSRNSRVTFNWDNLISPRLLSLN